MKTAWITGAKGFIGRHLARHLAANGCTVAGIGHGAWPSAEARRWGVSAWLNADLDVSSLGRLASLAPAPDRVFHLAGGSAVGPTFVNPLEDFHRTASTTAELLEWVRTVAPSARVICASSAAVYGSGHPGPIVEETAVAPSSPYGHHKAVMETIAGSYRANFGLHVSIVRLFSVYGAGLEKQLLWDLCGELARGEPQVSLGGTGDELRDWLHVSDAVRLLVAVAQAESRGGLTINGGTGDGVAVRRIAALLREYWGGSTELVFTGLRRTGDPESLIADVSRLRALGFAAQAGMPQAVADVVRWFKARQVE